MSKRLRFLLFKRASRYYKGLTGGVRITLIWCEGTELQTEADLVFPREEKSMEAPWDKNSKLPIKQQT